MRSPSRRASRTPARAAPSCEESALRQKLRRTARGADTTMCGADGHAARRARGAGWQGLRGPAARITMISWLRARARASVSVSCD